MQHEQCEWCEKPHRYKFESVFKDDDYTRYACTEHFAKTQKLVFLDGRNTVAITDRELNELLKEIG